MKSTIIETSIGLPIRHQGPIMSTIIELIEFHNSLRKNSIIMSINTRNEKSNVATIRNLPMNKLRSNDKRTKRKAFIVPFDQNTPSRRAFKNIYKIFQGKNLRVLWSED